MEGAWEGLLLSEHAHRAANDMAVATAALHFAQRRHGADPQVASVIARLEASAQVQRLLCARPTGEPVDLDATLRRLCAAMASAHGGAELAVTVGLSSRPLMVADGTVMALAMCVHELVRNAIVHAPSIGARIRVEVRDDGVSTRVAVIDRGPPRTWGRAGGQGAAIVDQLVARIGGVVGRRVCAAGGRVEMVFKCLAVNTAGILEEA